ncbi:Mtc5p NDAI_0J01180 [Naumovozyma dairenensis CBS 421]|uniref:Maintenance of telomere capping protein 5 n=1 Tax=Naumovozyma dairenensis (strain ATCC 10597 / BCRC 20456 / CBS 421 / NBRC 0211 / NRRL Y-12639) TaxID=1071378 RepID=G0WGT2_NAUDC|nr:hypothetical protein NDAI_0J01180 [Naumovozyma dairenensis CBS 421]CCD27010.1 hypothetical protein NDAI_0J01180 [Naumovozyma dairenensis CBS 421]
MSYVGKGTFDSSTFGKSLSLKVDGGFNAISINPSGRDVVLASRRGLYIIDLDDPFSPPRWLQHITPWQVADVQWSPHPAKPYWVVSTSNQKALIWNLAKSSSDAIEHVLHGHSRAITDINFNPENPDILATCSIDTYVHAWDMRSPHKPFYSTSAWRSSASQVKWNFKDSNILASSHGNDVFIWDLRNGSTPLCQLVGHESSVNSIDFSRFKSTEIMSSSNDGTVKFWDYSVNNEDLTRTVTTDFPIWRGRYLPFGNGYCIMPQVGGNNSVYMMNLKSEEPDTKTAKLQPIYAFKGHTDRIIDFLWRSRYSEDDREFQLVTWSEDCDLRLWPISESIYQAVGFNREKEVEGKTIDYDYMTYNHEPSKPRTNQSNTYKKIKENFVTKSGLKDINNINHITWLSGVRINESDSPEDFFKERKLQNLGEEVSSVGHKFPKVLFEKISVSTGELAFTLSGPWSKSNPDSYVFLRISVKFPPNYPNKGYSPLFSIEENKDLSKEQRHDILLYLKEIGTKYTDAGLHCLEPSIRYLLGESISLDEIGLDEEQLLNFDIADHIDFDDISSIGSSDDNSELLTDTSSEYQPEVYDDTFDRGKNTFGRNLALDTTPIPNECGAIWTSAGKLLCFFPVTKKSAHKEHNILKLSKKSISKVYGRNETHKVIDSDEYDSGTSTSTRPKRYVETLTDDRGEDDDYENDKASNDGSLAISMGSFDSFADDWDDIMGNDIVDRNRIPALHGNFVRTFGSAPSASIRTDGSLKKNKNIIFSVDFSYLIPDKLELALGYQFLHFKAQDMAKYNALVAEEQGYDELSHCWQIFSDLLMNQNDDKIYNMLWDNHPMSLKWFVKQAMSYFEQENNVQMLAMLCCVLASLTISFMEKIDNTTDELQVNSNIENVLTFVDGNHSQPNWHVNRSRSSASQTGTPFSLDLLRIRSHTDYFTDGRSIASEDYFSSSEQGSERASFQVRSPGSINKVYGKGHLNQTHKLPEIQVELVSDEILDTINEPSRLFFDPEDVPKFETYIYQYSQLLYRWGLLLERAKILKLGSNLASMTGNNANILSEGYISGGIKARWIEHGTSGKVLSHNCTYCNLKITRNVLVCGNCQHVLHKTCAKEWWALGDECPSGCGCNCIELFDVR